MITNKIAYWRSIMNGGKGITRAHLARKIGVGRSFVSKLEKGIAMPGAELMFRVAQYLKQPIEAIFQQVDNGSTTKPTIFCTETIPERQLGKALSTLASSKSVSIPFPDLSPSKPGELTNTTETTKKERQSHGCNIPSS